MNVEVKLDPNYTETKIEIHTNQINEEISNLIKILESKTENRILVSKEGKLYIIEEKNIETIYSNQGKVYIRANGVEYISKNKLYELEEKLIEPYFIRISNSEIINFNKVENLDLNITGTIKITFKDKYVTYASRRNIKKIKEYLKI